MDLLDPSKKRPANDRNTRRSTVDVTPQSNASCNLPTRGRQTVQHSENESEKVENDKNEAVPNNSTFHKSIRTDPTVLTAYGFDNTSKSIFSESKNERNRLIQQITEKLNTENSKMIENGEMIIIQLNKKSKPKKKTQKKPGNEAAKKSWSRTGKNCGKKKFWATLEGYAKKLVQV
jgi:hypothetical protein